MPSFLTLIVSGLLVTFLVGCATNPVTGESQFSLVSEAQEIDLGEKNYFAYQQQQGGEYVTDPKLSAYVASVGNKLVAVSDRKNLPYEFVVLNNDVPNAWALPGGKIAINRGLLVQLDDEAQLASVLGHEIVHAAARHGASQMTRQQLMGMGVGVVAIASADTKYGDIAVAGSMAGAQAWQSQYGQAQELESDYYGMLYMSKAGYAPQAAVELQQLFVKMKQGKQSSWLDNLFASHPPSQQRVDKNRQTAKTLPGNKRNKTQFKRALAQVNRDQAAYNLHVQALQARQNKENAKALDLVGQAIKKQPKEALFYTTQGQMYLNDEKFKLAKDAFSQAKKLNKNNYMGHLGLGISQLYLKQYTNAETSIQQANTLLNSLAGTFYLAESLFAQGKKQQAKPLYEQVAGSQSSLADAAQKRLTSL